MRPCACGEYCWRVGGEAACGSVTDPNGDDPFPHITDKYFPLGLDDESGPDGEPYSPTPGAW
jgi:hypothetical protein